MQLTIQDLAKYLNVSQRTVYRWIDRGTLPACKINDQFRFNKAEILEWATSRRINIPPEFFEANVAAEAVPTIVDAVKNGGIHYRVDGKDKKTVLKNVVDIMRIPEDIDRDFLFQILFARENMASTGIGDGIAIPHVRNPVILNVDIPYIGICFLEAPIDFGALDGKMVYCLFTMISPTPRIHLQLISRLAFILRNAVVKKALEKRASREEILKVIEKTENSISDGDGLKK